MCVPQYYQWNEKYWDVTHKFVTGYLRQYYGGDLVNLAKDQQVECVSASREIRLTD